MNFNGESGVDVLNSRQIGDYSELSVLADFTGRGMRLAIPFGNSQDFDLLVWSKKQSRWLTLQVKTARRRGTRGGRIYVDTIRGSQLSKKRGYLPGAFDYLVAALPSEHRFWIIPYAEMEGRRCLTISDQKEAGYELL